jgi:hypothetical protein
MEKERKELLFINVHENKERIMNSCVIFELNWIDKFNLISI